MKLKSKVGMARVSVLHLQKQLFCVLRPIIIIVVIIIIMTITVRFADWSLYYYY